LEYKKENGILKLKKEMQIPVYDYFDELETEVAKHFSFTCDKNETKRVRDFLIKRKIRKI
jgi:hypothetical protein